LIEVLLAIFIFTAFLVVIYSFIQIGKNIYQRKSNEFIKKILFLRFKNQMEQDFSNIKKIISYNRENSEIAFLKKKKKKEYVIRYKAVKKKERIIIKRTAGDIMRTNLPDLDIKEFKILLIDREGNTTIIFEKAIMIKSIITYKVNNKEINEFLVFEL